MKSLLYTLCLCFVAAVYAQHTAEEWKSRIIYHILTDRFSKPGNGTDEACEDLSEWCGGNFNGIVDRLNYIEELGANAIWISPFILNTPRGYHGYWAKDLYQVDPNYGTEDELHNLIEKCHERDIWVMMDVVPNHMGYPYDCAGWPNPPTCTPDKLLNFTGFTPFDQESHYHTYCEIEDWENQTQLELCRLANLPDLNQTVPEVRTILLDWIRDQTEKYKFDGYRVDTVRHIELEFWGEYQEASNNFLLGEVWNEDPYYVARYQEQMDSLFNFPLHEEMRQVFNYDHNMRVIADGLEQQRLAFQDTQVLGVFMDNHDKARFLNITQDMALFKNSIAFGLITDGIPFVYYGTEQAYDGGNDPYCRESLWPNYDISSEMFQFHKTLISTRKAYISDMLATGQDEIYVDDNNLVVSRANHKVLGAFTNEGQGTNPSFTVTFPDEDDMDGREFVNVFDADDVITVSNNELEITLTGGLPKVYILEETGDNSAYTVHGSGLLVALAAVIAAFFLP